MTSPVAPLAPMRLGMPINYAGGFRETVDEVVELEHAGLELISVAEAYSFDAVSQLGYLAARTDKLLLASGVMQQYIRTPTLTAMTAAGLDYVSDGRFILGIGASGPQVIEGFHGVPYNAPLGRTREIVDICRKVWRRERLEHQGKYYQIPLPADQGTGLGKPLKLINHPVREHIPIWVAAIGPKNVELAAEIAEGWQPLFFHPEHGQSAWRDSLSAGLAKRDPSLGRLDIIASVSCAIVDGQAATNMLEGIRHWLALYIGGMGARGQNFYNELMRRMGYESAAIEIQDLYLAGKKLEAAAAVPVEFARACSLIGSKGFVRDQIAAFSDAGVTTLLATPLASTRSDRVALVETLRELLDE